jgi:hypothetical protein
MRPSLPSLSYRVALAPDTPAAGAPPGFPAPMAAPSPAAVAPPPLAAPPAPLPLGAGAPSGLDAPPVACFPTAGVPTGPAAPPAALSPAVGAPPTTPASLPTLPSMASAPPTVLAPPPALRAPSLLLSRRRGTPMSSPLRCPPLPSHPRRRRPNSPPSRPPQAQMGPCYLLHSSCRMPPCFAPSCWRRAFHMFLSTRLEGPRAWLPPGDHCLHSAVRHHPPCALLRMLLLPFSLPPGQPLRLLANGPRTPHVLLSRSRRLSTPLSASTPRPIAVSLARASRMAPPHPLATAPTPSSPRPPRPQPFALLFMLRRRPSPTSGQPSLTSLRRTPFSTPGGAIRSCRPSAGTPSPTTSSQRSLARQRIGF